jgi:integrase
MQQTHLAGRHRLRASSRAKLEYDLAPVVERYGHMPVQALTKRDIDVLVGGLLTGGTTTAKGRTRKAWSAVAINKVTQSISAVLADAVRQGLVARNVAEHVDRIEVAHRDVDTFTEAEVQQFLASVADDRLGHTWELALSGLRRGEIAGLRWSDVDLDAKTLTIVNNRVVAGGKRTVENNPKSVTSGRTLPLPNRLVTVLKAARKRQIAERLALGAGGPWTYVVCNEAGQPYSPGALSRCAPVCSLPVCCNPRGPGRVWIEL